MRSRLVILVIAILSIINMAGAFAANPPDIYAEAGCVINVSNRQILYEKKADELMYPASTTKIMTSLVALKRGDLESVVNVDAQAAGCEGSSLYLSEGDKLTLRNLLYGMMLVSGNDAAVAIAAHIGGSGDAFVDIMNAEAKKIGASHTHFVNPHGLPDKNHYTTAHDLALITANAYTIPEFERIVSSAKRTIYFTDGSTRQVFNTNRLLGSYSGANGVKTGYTNAAGCCLVAAAKRNGVQLVAVVLNSDERWEDAANLLDYGFAVIEQQMEKAAL